MALHGQLYNQILEMIMHQIKNQSISDESSMFISSGSSDTSGIIETRGSKWFEDAVSPPIFPNIITGQFEGDFYLNSSTGDVFQLQLGVWTFLLNIKGARGSIWYEGTVFPIADPNILLYQNDGDYYLNTDTGNVYQLQLGVWTFLLNIKGGPKGDPGINGSIWYEGSGFPVTDTNILSYQRNGDYYLDISTGNVYQFQLGTWTFLLNIKGAKGDPGTNGTNGRSGSRWYEGPDFPVDDPNILLYQAEWDYYLNTSTGDLYELQSGQWIFLLNIKGVKGDPGTNGTNGVRGSIWTMGSGVPSITSDNIENDCYLDTDNDEVYQVKSGTWSDIGNIKGIRGSIWFEGSGSPVGIILPNQANYDNCLDTDTGDVYQLQSNNWVKVGNIKGLKGDIGEPGSSVDKGDTGPRGATWFEGSGSPVGTIIDTSVLNDYYLDTNTGDVYQLQSTGWTLIGNIRGLKGDIGLRGATWLEGPESPVGKTIDTSVNNDYYLDTDTGDVYQLQSTGWTLIGNIKGNRGAAWFEGSGYPYITNIPNQIDNDYYLDVSNGNVYQLQLGNWTYILNIMGPKGDTGPRGATWFEGSGSPVGTIIDTSVLNDYYLDTDTGDVYQLRSTDWTLIGNIKGFKGDKGDPGEPGSAVDKGDTGPRGATWFEGSGSPVGMVIDGLSINDYFLDTYLSDIYQYQIIGWTRIGNIKGLHGDTGIRGSSWFEGIGNPIKTLDQFNNDCYLDTDTGDVYQVQLNLWIKIGNIKGSPGPKGDPGVFTTPTNTTISVYPTSISIIRDGESEIWLTTTDNFGDITSMSNGIRTINFNY